jgi:hypothetical protein
MPSATDALLEVTIADLHTEARQASQ